MLIDANVLHFISVYSRLLAVPDYLIRASCILLKRPNWMELTAMGKTPHVAILIETSRSYTRAILKGVNKYMAEHGQWSVYMELRALESRTPAWLKNWRGDGVLTRTNSQAMADAIKNTGVPVVELRATKLNLDFPFVGCDNHAIGQMVFEHLKSRGFRHFGVYTLDTEDFFEERCRNFVATVEDSGFDVHEYHAYEHRERPRKWEEQQDDVVRWVAELPKPIGLLACTDQLGFWLLDACKRANVAVPEEVAVVGVENDESLCTMASPSLSSVAFMGERVGYTAAALLGRMMAGEEPVPAETLIEPYEIVVRQSSDIVAIEDEEIAAAVRFIRETACQGIGVQEVVDNVAISRSALERRMREVIGHTPQEEIRRVRLNRVRELLLETDVSLSTISQLAGFQHPQYMAELFKKTFKQTPGRFRREAKK